MGVYRKGKNWYIDYRVLGRRRREMIGPNRKLAEKVYAKRKLQIAEGKFFDQEKVKKFSFEELCVNYVEYAKVNKLSWKRDQISVNHLRQYFSQNSLSEIKPDLIEAYKKERLKLVSQATVNRELACLRFMFSKAVEWEKADVNPVKRVKLFRENNQRIRYLSMDEIGRLVACSSEDLKPIILTALYTGMRSGEILKLKWEDVDLTQRIIYVANSKNGEMREIPIKDSLYDVLKRMDRKSQYIFVKGDGNPYASIHRQFTAVLKRAGIENFRFHDLRHTFASHLVMSGAELMTVKELLGHKTLRMTLRYSHLSASHKRKAIDMLKFSDGHYLDTQRVVCDPVEVVKSLIDNESEGSPNGMAVDLKSTVRKDLRVRILRPPCFAISDWLLAFRKRERNV